MGRISLKHKCIGCGVEEYLDPPDEKYAKNYRVSTFPCCICGDKMVVKKHWPEKMLIDTKILALSIRLDEEEEKLFVAEITKKFDLLITELKVKKDIYRQR